MKILFFTTLLFFLFTTPAHAQVVLSEVYPAPTSEEKEWIELYNSSTNTIDITGWKLFDHFSNKTELTTFSNIEIAPHEFLVFELNTNKLNNAEEKITLENTVGLAVSSIQYTATEPQKSFSFLFIDTQNISEIIEITQPTKGTLNPTIPIATPVPTPTVTPVASATLPTISHPTPTPTTTPPFTATNSVQEQPTTTELASDQKENLTQVNKQLALYKAIKQQLELPKLSRIEKEGLEKVIPKLSYLVQKKVSKEGVINAIIGGTLLLFTGLLL